MNDPRDMGLFPNEPKGSGSGYLVLAVVIAAAVLFFVFVL